MPNLTNKVSVRVESEADTKGFKEAEDGMSRFGTSMGKIGEIAAGIGLARIGEEILDLGRNAVKMGIDAASNLETSKTALTTLMGDSGKAMQLITKIQEQAKKTPFDQQGLIDMNQVLIGSGMAAGTANKTVMQLGDALAATGKGTSELKRIGNTMSQVFGKGKADAVDFKEMVNAGWVTVKKDVADTLGVTSAEFEDLVSSGAINFEVLEKTLERTTSKGGRFFGAMANQSQTFQGKMSNLVDTLNIGLGDLFTKTGLFDAMKSGLDTLIAGFGFILPLVLQFANALKTGFGVAVEFLRTTFGPLFSEIGQQVAMMIESFGGMEAIQTAFMNFWTAMQPILVAFGVAIALLLAGFTGFVAGIINALPGLMLMFQGLLQFITGVLNLIVGLFTGNWDLVKKGTFQMVEGVYNFIVGGFTAVMGFIEGFVKGVVAFFTGLYNALVGHSIIPDMVMAIVGWVEKMRDMVDNLLQMVQRGWENVWNGMKSFVMRIWDGIVGFMKGKINDILGMINGMIKAFNGVAGKTGSSVKIPEVPFLAEGATNFRGGAAVVGEQGPELVTLPRGANVIPNHALGSNVTVNQYNNNYGSVDMENSLRRLVYKLAAT